MPTRSRDGAFWLLLSFARAALGGHSWSTDQRRTCCLVRCLPMHSEYKESPGRAGAFKEFVDEDASRGAESLDAPILSQSTNQARTCPTRSIQQADIHSSASRAKRGVKRPLTVVLGVAVAIAEALAARC